MCTAGAPPPPPPAHSWDVGPGPEGSVGSRRWMCPPRPPLRSKRISVCSVRAVYHGRAPHAPPLPSGASAMLRLGGYGGGRLKAGGRLSKPLPVLPYHRALHASVAGGRARRGAADLHPVSAARGRWGPRDVRFTVIGGEGRE